MTFIGGGGKRSAISLIVENRRCANETHKPFPHGARLYDASSIDMTDRREAPYRARPPQEVVELLQRLENQRLYVMHRMGPTSFVVHEEGAGSVNQKVMLGPRPSCSCAGAVCKELCLHILFVMVKVMRVPPSNPLVWQLSLTDRELEEVFRCSTLPSQPPRPDRRAQPATGDKAEHGAAVKRRALEEEEQCPICYEAMSSAEPDALVRIPAAFPHPHAAAPSSPEPSSIHQVSPIRSI